MAAPATAKLFSSTMRPEITTSAQSGNTAETRPVMHHQPIRTGGTLGILYLFWCVNKICRPGCGRQSCREPRWGKTERPGLTLIANTSVGADQVKPIRPARIVLFDAVLHRIEQRRKCNVKIANARTRHLLALRVCSRVPENDPILDIAPHLPHVTGVSFGNINHVECDAILVPLVKLVERGNLPAKGRSSIAAEDQYHRTNASMRTKLNRPRAIHQRQAKVRRTVTGTKMSLPGVLPHRLEWKQKERNGTYMRHDPREPAGRLPHGHCKTRQGEQIER